ncbi:outer membrane beta-barrel protein, partial [Acinetobacter baumannii]
NSKNSNNSDIGSYTYNLDGTPKQPALLQQGIGSGTTINHTAQIDYENPLSDDSKFEAGARAAIRDFNNVLDQYRFNSATNQYVLVP